MSNNSLPYSKKRKQFWWNNDCTLSRNRLKFWFSLWKSCSRPRQGPVYDSYKMAKQCFRKVCRTAVNSNVNFNLKKLDQMYCNGNSRKMWNAIKQCKNVNSRNQNCISQEKLKQYFIKKFAYDRNSENAFISNLRKQVDCKFESVVNVKFDFIFSEFVMKTCIKKLKNNCSPGIDGITSEHIKYASDTDLKMHLCKLFSVCFMYGVTPTSFNYGMLVPLLKKSTLDPTVAKHYRPVIVSTTFSKILELYVLYESNPDIFNDYQFGFVKNRGTNTAVSVVHDIGEYCVRNGSQMCTCSLDAEGAFDGIPMPVLFAKIINILSDMSWRLLYVWYSNIKVQIKWGNLSDEIPVCKGTKQGGLTSPYMFNIFYMDLINILSKQQGDITIGCHKYNAFCYADDILLTSITVSGLQASAVLFIENHGLRFNPEKTSCFIKGKNPFYVEPKWHINNVQLSIQNTVNYLGVTMGSNNVNDHINARISSCRKSFYSMQNAGLCDKGLRIGTALNIFNSTCRNALIYGCESVYLSKQNLNDINKLQAKLLKCMIGIGPSYRTTVLLDALKTQKVSDIIDCNNLVLFNNLLGTCSAARSFNLFMIKKRKYCPGTLLDRVNKICQSNNINMSKFIYDRDYINIIKRKFHQNVSDGLNGIVDSLRTLFMGDRHKNLPLIKLLLKAF